MKTVSCTGVSIIAVFAWVACMFIGEWQHALFASAIVIADVVLSTYLDARRNKKSKGTL